MPINYKIATFCWSAIILVLSITPGNYIPPLEFELISIDTLVHTFFYMVLVFLILKWRKTSTKEFIKIIAVFLFTILYGYIIELIQGNLIPGRFYDLYDVLSNSIGSAIGLIIYFVIPNNK